LALISHLDRRAPPAVGNNKLRHETLQHFMLANDSVTVAIEIPMWLDEAEISSCAAAPVSDPAKPRAAPSLPSRSTTRRLA
jgi:hypothetical protein